MSSSAILPSRIYGTSQLCYPLCARQIGETWLGVYRDCASRAVVSRWSFSFLLPGRDSAGMPTFHWADRDHSNIITWWASVSWGLSISCLFFTYMQTYVYMYVCIRMHLLMSYFALSNRHGNESVGLIVLSAGLYVIYFKSRYFIYIYIYI